MAMHPVLDKDVDKKIRPHIHPDNIPIEITRSRTRLENLHFFVSSGDNISYKVTKSSDPLDNASVTFNTQQGWKKTVRSNADGEAVLQVIQDYFTPWEELDNRNIYNYLVVAEYTGEEGGTYKGQSYRYTHYTATLSDGYRPSKVMYSSLSWALGIFLIVSLLIGGGVVFHRKRRIKVYREIQLTNA